MSLPAGLLASVMGGQPLTSMLSIPCGICTASGTDQPDQAVTLVHGTLVCPWHAAVEHDAHTALQSNMARVAWRTAPSVSEAAARVAAIDHKGQLNAADRHNIAAAALGLPEGSE